MDDSSKKLTSVWVLLIVALLAIAGVTYYFSLTKKKTVNNPDQFASWQTYRNDEHGFEIKYPDSLAFIESNYQSNIWELSFYYKNDSKSGPLVVSVGKNIDIATDANSRIVGKKNIDGVEGDTIALFTGDVNSHCERTNIKRGDVTFIFDDACGQNPSLFNEMISTFKFTGSGNETASWKTYTNINTKYGFKIKYPSDWSDPVWNSNNNQVSFDNGKILINYYSDRKDLPENFYSKNKQEIILPGGHSYSGMKTEKNYCMVLLTNEIFTGTNFESFEPEKEPIYSLEGPMFSCDYKNNRDALSSEYPGYENIYNQMVSTFEFFIK